MALVQKLPTPQERSLEMRQGLPWGTRGGIYCTCKKHLPSERRVHDWFFVNNKILSSILQNNLEHVHVQSIIIRCRFFFPSIGRQPTTWPANNCLQIMVCSCVVPSKRVLLQIIICSCIIGTTNTFSREKWLIASLSCQVVTKIWKETLGSNDKTIIELGRRKISWLFSVSPINYLPWPSASANNWSARHWQITIFCSTLSNNNYC